MPVTSLKPLQACRSCRCNMLRVDSRLSLGLPSEARWMAARFVSEFARACALTNYHPISISTPRASPLSDGLSSTRTRVPSPGTHAYSISPHLDCAGRSAPIYAGPTAVSTSGLSARSAQARMSGTSFPKSGWLEMIMHI